MIRETKEPSMMKIQRVDCK